ncbi:MAG: TlpA family protein disulfide reductase [Acidobacteria bacterium]|nr:TlpA family protein disulfide reductase [Acidobacteriota bacterium]
MFRKIGILTAVLLLAAAVGCGRSEEELAREYGDGYAAIKQTFEENLQQITSRDEYDKLQEQKKIDLEALLQRFAGHNGDRLDLIRIRILKDMGKTDEAEVLITRLLEENSPLAPQVKLERVPLLVEKGQGEAAAALLAEIDGRVPVDENVYEAYQAVVFSAPSPEAVITYGQRLVEAETLPPAMSQNVKYVYSQMAHAAKNAGDLEKAKSILAAAIAQAGPENKPYLENELRLMNLIGQPAAALAAETWLNSKPLTLDELRGKVVLIDFWATWCPPCIAVIPTLVRIYEKYKSEGLEMIGFTRIYGTYRDDIQNKGRVEKDTELELTREFLKRYGMTYPIAVADGQDVFEAYSVRGIPTLFFINDEGIIVDVEVGSGGENHLEAKVRELLDLS